MNEEKFVEKIKKYFGYLESDYDFRIVFESTSPLRPKTDGIVKYASDTTVLLIDSETAQAALRFLRIQDDEKFYLDPVSIHEYLVTSDAEKRVLLSQKMEDQDQARAIHKRVFLLSRPGWDINAEDSSIQLNNRLENYANWLRENAEICLLGNFSRWPAFYEYKVNRLIADEIRRGGQEYVKAIIKDENGKPKVIERRIFENERNHVEKLNRELLS